MTKKRLVNVSEYNKILANESNVYDNNHLLK